MKFTTIEEFLAYLEASYSEPTEATIDEDGPDETLKASAFDNNAKALNVLFRNAMNGRDFNTAWGILSYANELQIVLTKGH